MSGSQPGETPLPEVPDEFAAAYREAYERALLEQTDGPRHRRPPQYRPGHPLTEPTGAGAGGAETEHRRSDEAPGWVVDDDHPERRGRLTIGTHRRQVVVPESTTTWYDRVRDSRAFVPALLLGLVLSLLLAAYVLGRAFSAAVGQP